MMDSVSVEFQAAVSVLVARRTIAACPTAKSVVEARRRVEMATIFGSEALRWKEGEGRKEFRERCG